MTDLLIAIAVMTLVCAMAWYFAAMVAYRETGQTSMLGVAVCAVGLIYFLLYAAGQLYWARIVPHSAAIIYTNFSSVFAALASGWAWRLANTPRWRRGLASALLAVASFATIVWPLLSIALRPPPLGGDQWRQGVAMQTSWATCSPAAAATLLRQEGIQVSERQMIPLCLTDYEGTPTLGLYRGVKRIANQHGFRVQIVEPSLAQLLADDDWPVLLMVELPFGTEDRRFTEQWGWIPGTGHSVVALGRSQQGGIVIGDPAVGLEVWLEDEMRVLWHGRAIRLRR